MKHLKTLRVRFALWTAGLLLGALVIFGIFVYVSMSRSLATAVDETLHLTAMQLLAEVEVDDGTLIVKENPLEDAEFAQLREQGMSMRVLYPAGQPVAAFGPYQDLPVSPVDLSVTDPSGAFTTVTHPGTQDPVRVYTTPISLGNQVFGILQVVQNLEDVRSTLNLLLINLLIGGPLIVILAGGGGYFLAARALAPIDKITRTARHISAHDLSTRLNLPQTEDEVGRLGDTFDSMMDRLEEAFQRERQFTADASHELRTPMSAMQTIIGSIVARQRTPAEYEQALFDLGREAEQMRILTEGLLQLARNDFSTQHVKLECVDVSTLLRDVVDSLLPLAEEKGLQITDNIPDGLSVMGDSDGLIRLFVNLLDNAIKYTEQGSITVSAKSLANQVLEISIRDTGVGIAAEHLPYIFNRFYRVDESRSTEGIGLGLAIALDIARAHGGNISVESEVGRGTIFVVQLSTK
jgi:signal transduction histidine kinase